MPGVAGRHNEKIHLLQLGMIKYSTYRPSTMSMPARICCNRLGLSLPMRSARNVRSTANICDALATQSSATPATEAERNVFPGAAAQFKLLVRGTQKTVARRLRLSALPCTMTTGRRNPGAEPLGSGKSAHQSSPWLTSTTQCAQGLTAPQPKQMHPALSGVGRRRYSSPQ